MAAIETVPYGATVSARKTTYSLKSSILFIVILGVSYMFNAMDRQVFPALLGPIREQYGLTLPQGGMVATIFTVTVAIFAALSGWCMARFSRRTVLLGGLVAYSAFTFATPLATGFASLTVLRALTGFGEALQVGAVFACIGGYFGASRGTAMGAIQSFFGLGAFLGPVLGTRLEAWAGSWSVSFYAFGVAGIVVAIIAALVLPRDFTEAGQVLHVDLDKTHKAPLWSRNLVLGAISFGLVGWSFFAYTSLYATYMHGPLGFSQTDAGAALGMYGIGAMCGVVGGWLGDRLGSKGILGALLVYAGVSYVLFHGSQSLLVHMVMSFTFGLMMSGFLFTRFMSVLQRNAHPSQIGYTGSVALGAFYLPGPFAGYLFGQLVNSYGWTTAATVMVVAPPLIGFALMSLFDYSKVRAA